MVASKIMDKSDRIASIAANVESYTRSEQIYFRSKLEELPVIRLANDVLVYRMKNGRTKVEQYRYLEDNRKSEDFFENGEENISAQRAQHEILLKLAKDEKGSIYRELERVCTQTESLLVTFDGVVLDGNRRLAAMRALFEHNARTYGSFSDVDAVILPKGANDKDLELLEVERQMIPDTKLAYGWVERRMKLHQHAEVLGIPRQQIMQVYRFNREGDINIELRQLKLAVEYLEEFLKKPHAYHEIAQSEQIFTELQKAIRGKPVEEARLRQYIGYMIVKESSNIGSRAYDYRHIFGRDFDEIITRYANYKGIDLAAIAERTNSDDLSSDDDFLSDLEERDPGGSEERCYAGLMPIFEDQTKSEEIVENISRVFDSLKEETREKDSRQAALKKVQKVNQILHEVDPSTADPATFERIKSQLDAIIKISEVIQTKIDGMIDDDTEVS